MDFQLNLATETVAHTHPKAPLIVESQLSLREVLQLMQQRHRGSVMICSPENTLLGIFTERDVVQHLAAGTDMQTPIEQVMVREPVTVQQTDTVGQAIATMAAGGYRRLPVVDQQGQPMGVLGVLHLLNYMVEHFPKVVYTLPPQPHQASPDREGA